MGLAFSSAHGSAKKGDLDYIKLETGINTFRLVGEILPRYAYWKQYKGNSIPVECLSFDRAKEKFLNVETDWFAHYFPEEKCVWSYVIQVIDIKDGKLKLLGLKKKLYDQIKSLAQEIGDPTDFTTGWDCVVEKVKTGPHIFNVEYKLKERSITVRALTEDELEKVKALKPIDEVLPRPKEEDQRKFIESAWVNTGANSEEKMTDEEKAAFEKDVPF